MWERGVAFLVSWREGRKPRARVSVCRGWETDPRDVKADIRTVSLGCIPDVALILILLDGRIHNGEICRYIHVFSLWFPFIPPLLFVINNHQSFPFNIVDYSCNCLYVLL